MKHRKYAISALLLGSAISASANASSYDNLLNMCKACHGENGISQFSSIPNLKWQNADYITAQLQAFKSGQRPDKTMSKVAKLLSKDDMTKMAQFFSEGINQGKGH